MNELIMQGLLAIIGIVISIVAGVIVHYVQKWIGLELEKDAVEKLLMKIRNLIFSVEKSNMSGREKQRNVLSYANQFSAVDKELLLKHKGNIKTIIEDELLKLQPVIETKKSNVLIKRERENLEQAINRFREKDRKLQQTAKNPPQSNKKVDIIVPKKDKQSVNTKSNKE